ncbi:MAG: H4MPT-linked C1 transfer pathway protein [Gammaproteobacteria bacterium]|uniref:hydantoinase/oxoprolinase family protein n=1 Tax=Methylotuvimicrobium sp. TaxID=2822413 RepID=UPI001D86BD0D|nr:H4MPT-linked C1 transfer pathway protein [Gammaproteobacteria bacterium]
MQTNIIGWDIGGAHLKAALINELGEALAIVQRPCALWQGIEQLQQAVQAVTAELPEGRYRHAITMTGELVDHFESREQGVQRIVEAMSVYFPGDSLWIYSGLSGFIRAGSVLPEHSESIASANWLASASFAARNIDSGLFIDIGSTTTDVIAMANGKINAKGFTDYKRLISEELIYTGVVRTPVMAIAQTALFKGVKIGLMAEYFATMADVYRITGELDEAHDQNDTADGGEKTVTASARRLSRMIGHEVEHELPECWRHFALYLRNQQLHKIQMSCERQISRIRLPSDKPFVGAGVGRFLVKQLAANLGHPYLDFNDLFEQSLVSSPMSAADCAPAIAVAYLALAQFK